MSPLTSRPISSPLCLIALRNCSTQNLSHLSLDNLRKYKSDLNARIIKIEALSKGTSFLGEKEAAQNTLNVNYKKLEKCQEEIFRRLSQEKSYSEDTSCKSKHKRTEETASQSKQKWTENKPFQEMNISPLTLRHGLYFSSIIISTIAISYLYIKFIYSDLYKSDEVLISDKKGLLGINSTYLVKTLGASMYSGSVAQTAVKELLQNAFDSVKEAVHKGLISEGDIQIIFNRSDRSICIKDNGMGMNSDIVQQAFFTVGGTHKDMPPHLCSGGYGQAKIAFLLGAKKIHLKTTRDGITTEVIATPSDLLNNSFNISSSRTPNARQGSSVQIWIQETDQSGKPIPFDSDYFYYPILRAPLIGPTKITVQEIGSILSSYNELKSGVYFNTPLFSKVTFDWGTANIYCDPTRNSSTVTEEDHRILSSGIYQFSQGFSIEKNHRELIPYEITIDIQPNVFPDHPRYPFTNNRETFRECVKKDIETIIEKLQAMAKHDKGITLARTFADSYCMGDEWQPFLRTKQQQTWLSNTISRLANYMEVEDPTGFIRCPEGIYINYTNQKYTEGQNQKEKKEFFKEIGDVVKDMREALSSPDYRYRLLMSPKFYTGIGISEKFYGVYTDKEAPRGILINPFGDNAKTLEGVRRRIIETIIHEFAHCNVKYHGENHNSEMLNIQNKLADAGILSKCEKRIDQILEKHKELYWSMHRQFQQNRSNTDKQLEI